MRLPNAEINLSPRGQGGRGQGVGSPRLSDPEHCLEVYSSQDTLSLMGLEPIPRHRSHWGFMINRVGQDFGDLLHTHLVNLLARIQEVKQCALRHPLYAPGAASSDC